MHRIRGCIHRDRVGSKTACVRRRPAVAASNAVDLESG